jgi:hypothetical protein
MLRLHFGNPARQAGVVFQNRSTLATCGGQGRGHLEAAQAVE